MRRRALVAAAAGAAPAAAAAAGRGRGAHGGRGGGAVGAPEEEDVDERARERDEEDLEVDEPEPPRPRRGRAGAAASASAAAAAARAAPDIADVDAGAASPESNSIESPWRITPEMERNRQLFPDPPDANTFRILVATDSHVGFAENDMLRRDDSFVSFEEALHCARLNHVDMIVHAGDLFHHNKPSRSTLYRSMALLRQYCFGDRPVSFEIVSNQAQHFSTTGHANYEDPNVNISIPIFAIHGNHDDPAGLGGLSALELLHVSNFINFFGKTDKVDQIVNTPILMRKGDTKLALYGLGNVRDERLHQAFAMRAVHWVRPDEGTDEWFNLALIHQNRCDHVGNSSSNQSVIRDTQLPDFLDVAIWGHEHECLMDTPLPHAKEQPPFVVVQPGSSVATSLCPAEAVSKKLAILEVRGSTYRLTPVPLYTVRPLVIDDVVLADCLPPTAAESLVQIEKLLVERVNHMLEDVRKNPEYQNPDRPTRPLVRLRVNHTGFERLNVARFGQKFVDRVANPEDILLFMRNRTAGATLTTTMAAARRRLGRPDLDDAQRDAGADALDESALIRELIAQQIRGHPLSVLPESQLFRAVQQSVEHRETSSIRTHFKAQLDSTRDFLKRNADVVEKVDSAMRSTAADALQKVDLAESIEQFRQRHAVKDEPAGGGGAAADGSSSSSSSSRRRAAGSRAAAGALADAGAADAGADGADAGARAGRGRAARAPAKAEPKPRRGASASRRRNAAVDDDGDDDGDDDVMELDDDDDEGDAVDDEGDEKDRGEDGDDVKDDDDDDDDGDHRSSSRRGRASPARGRASSAASAGRGRRVKSEGTPAAAAAAAAVSPARPAAAASPARRGAARPTAASRRGGRASQADVVELD